MNEAAEDTRYEAAAMYRDWISMVRDIFGAAENGS